MLQISIDQQQFDPVKINPRLKEISENLYHVFIILNLS